METTWCFKMAQAIVNRGKKEKGAGMTTAFDYKGQPSVWLTDQKMKRYIQGDNSAKKRQEKGDINDKNQVLIYSKSSSDKK